MWKTVVETNHVHLEHNDEIHSWQISTRYCHEDHRGKHYDPWQILMSVSDRYFQTLITAFSLISPTIEVTCPRCNTKVVLTRVESVDSTKGADNAAKSADNEAGS